MKRRDFALLAAPLALVLVAAACGGSESAGGSAGVPDGTTVEALAAVLADGNGAAGISVSGQGVAVAEPDIANLQLGVSSLADTAIEARDRAAAAMTALIASLKASGVDEEDFHTSFFSIDPEVDYRPNGEPVIRGYRVTSTLAVIVREIDRAGAVIDNTVDAVGDDVRVQSVAFSIDDPTAVQSQARALAMADARAKAEELAELAGVELGSPTAISESSTGGPPPVYRSLPAAGAEVDISTPISPGQMEIAVTVQVTYAIS